MNEVAIIGAGPAGLAAARYLASEGFAPVLFERGSTIGGQWSGDRTRSGVWPSMRTNTSRILTAFSDLPHPDRSPTYPASHAIRDYLHEYAERFSLTPCVQLNTPVVHLERAAESGAAFDPSREEATFRIAVTDNASQVLCPALCRALLPFRGRVSCQFVALHAGTFEDMERGRLDLTLNADDGYTPSRFHREVIYEDEFVCVVAKSSRYTGRFTLRQYLDGTHVGMTVLTGQPMIHDQQLAALGQRRRSVLEVPYFGAAIRCVPGTDLIATVPRRFAEIQRHNRAIKFLPPPREIHGFKYLMIWHPRLHTDPAHVWLRGLIATAAAELGK